MRNFHLWLRASEQFFTALIRSVGQVADASPTDNQMSMTLVAIAAVARCRLRPMRKAVSSLPT